MLFLTGFIAFKTLSEDNRRRKLKICYSMTLVFKVMRKEGVVKIIDHISYGISLFICGINTMSSSFCTCKYNNKGHRSEKLQMCYFYDLSVGQGENLDKLYQR